MNNYSETVKEAMVLKLTSPGALSASSLAQEVGIHQSTLSRWVREYGNVSKMGGVMKGRRPRDWTVALPALVYAYAHRDRGAVEEMLARAPEHVRLCYQELLMQEPGNGEDGAA